MGDGIFEGLIGGVRPVEPPTEGGRELCSATCVAQSDIHVFVSRELVICNNKKKKQDR